VSGITLDAGGLIALERGDRRILTLIERTLERRLRITVPATALAQVVRQPARQVRIVRLVRQLTTDLVPLDGPAATATGRLLATTGTTDIVDAHVVVCARRARQVVVTSDARDIRRLDPDLPLFSV
jgi:predicted nucleic acid-binding protein